MSGLVPSNVGDALRGKRIFFGHQSVGYNIVEGVEALARERSDLGLRIVETKSPGDFATPVFAHAKNGENYDPSKKIREFAATIEGGVGEKADIAFFKFCYVDFAPETDVEKLFTEYKTTLARLRGQFPKTQFVHVTVPLTIVQTGPKAAVKKLLGRKLWGADANVTRHKFNELMRREYRGREPFFDLAQVESTRMDERSVAFEQAGASYPALAAEYSFDGKHLNPSGARWVAAHLLKTLAQL